MTYIGVSLKSRVLNLAKLSQFSGLDGVVASPHEIDWIRSTCGDNFTIVTPGIRPLRSVTHDQKRVMPPSAAIEKGANIIVIGRPVIQAENPLLVVDSLFKDNNC